MGLASGVGSGSWFGFGFGFGVRGRGRGRGRGRVKVRVRAHLEQEILGGVGSDEALGEHALKAGAVRLVERVRFLLAHAQVCGVSGDRRRDLGRGFPVILVEAVVAVDEDHLRRVSNAVAVVAAVALALALALVPGAGAVLLVLVLVPCGSSITSGLVGIARSWIEQRRTTGRRLTGRAQRLAASSVVPTRGAGQARRQHHALESQPPEGTGGVTLVTPAERLANTKSRAECYQLVFAPIEGERRTVRPRAATECSTECVCPRVVPKGRADRDRNGQTGWYGATACIPEGTGLVG